MISIITIESQLFVIPTLRITHSTYLNGNRSIELIWLKWGIELTF